MYAAVAIERLNTHLRKLRILSNTRGSDIFSEDTWMLSVISTHLFSMGIVRIASVDKGLPLRYLAKSWSLFPRICVSLGMK